MDTVGLSLATTLLALWSVAVAVTDLRYRRIPNVLSLGSWLVGGLHLLFWGGSLLGAPASSALLAAGLALLATLPGYATRQLGAGDVKFLVGIGLLTSWPLTLICFATGALLGAAMVMVSRNKLALIMSLPLAWRQPGSSLMNWACQAAPKRHLPFGTCLAVGLCAALWWRTQT
jgi:prepilin peptidase CpaA